MISAAGKSLWPVIPGFWAFCSRGGHDLITKFYDSQKKGRLTSFEVRRLFLSYADYNKFFVLIRHP